MPTIYSISTVNPPFIVQQEEARLLTRSLFKNKFKQIDRLLKVFENSHIQKRHLCMPLEWFEDPHSFQERNELYSQFAVQYGVQAIQKCLTNETMLIEELYTLDIDAIFMISSSGISTPTIEARIMNQLPFRADTKRIPLFGLGCAGGAMGISRAYEYCRAFPHAKVLVLAIEFCSLTFQKDDFSKSNLVGSSLFSDGIACALIGGKDATISANKPVPQIVDTTSAFMPNAEDVMGWDIRNNGFHVIFSKSIPSIIEHWLGPTVEQFYQKNHMNNQSIQHFIAHPGGEKVLLAYEKALHFPTDKMANSKNVLREFGNMSSPTILYVLKRFMEQSVAVEEQGLMAALGPGFCAELLLLQWK
ncbi:MAG TPA: 3-oxoacyl-[acyl-carrier-protein] synthase III C-terminal domain-containing protein [Sporosarcina sp.]|nr:3-oxoacyl-[acyl-carrier-protein] synthase III C-terminal domain-containing protein [Sporosarcina sp.]